MYNLMLNTLGRQTTEFINMLELFFIIFKIRIRPVSYTHLDGYLGNGSVAFRHYERPTVFRPADAAYVPHHDGVAGVDARNILRPVSYTHLDVYKRQTECLQGSHIGIFSLFGEAMPLFAVQ